MFHIKDINNSLNEFNKPRRSVYLEDAQQFYSKPPSGVKVAPYIKPINNAFEKQSNVLLFEALKPIIYVLKLIGLFPIKYNDMERIFQVSPQYLGYSVGIFLLISLYIGYIKWDKIEMVRSAEGRFEEAVIDYLFTIYLVPIFLNLVVLYEARKQAQFITDWSIFERIYLKITKKKLEIFMGSKPFIISVGLSILACGTMVVNHITMVNFKVFQVIPYCYINMVTYVLGGLWFLQCDVIGHVATLIADDFQSDLKHIGTSSRVADYRSLWMMLSKLTQDIGNASAYTIIFLCLYLFLIITLTIYGLLSQLQGGFGIKDIGLTITASFSIGFLFFVCNKAHYASKCVRVYFQKKLLLVELTWMNDEAQQEINMFLKATEMNTTEISASGFFDINRSLYKSLLATMVTYLVVLLQFQISIPGDDLMLNVPDNSTVMDTNSII